MLPSNLPIHQECDDNDYRDGLSESLTVVLLVEAIVPLTAHLNIMTGALKATRMEHQPLLTTLDLEGNLLFQKHTGYNTESSTDSTNSFETQLDVEERKRLEHSLLRKLDRRMSILVLIYILNCKCHCALFYDFYKMYIRYRQEQCLVSRL